MHQLRTSRIAAKAWYLGRRLRPPGVSLRYRDRHISILMLPRARQRSQRANAYYFSLLSPLTSALRSLVYWNIYIHSTALLSVTHIYSLRYIVAHLSLRSTSVLSPLLHLRHKGPPACLASERRYVRHPEIS